MFEFLRKQLQEQKGQLTRSMGEGKLGTWGIGICGRLGREKSVYSSRCGRIFFAAAEGLLVLSSNAIFSLQDMLAAALRAKFY